MERNDFVFERGVGVVVDVVVFKVGVISLSVKVKYVKRVDTSAYRTRRVTRSPGFWKVLSGGVSFFSYDPRHAFLPVIFTFLPSSLEHFRGGVGECNTAKDVPHESALRDRSTFPNMPAMIMIFWKQDLSSASLTTDSPSLLSLVYL